MPPPSSLSLKAFLTQCSLSLSLFLLAPHSSLLRALPAPSYHYGLSGPQIQAHAQAAAKSLRLPPPPPPPPLPPPSPPPPAPPPPPRECHTVPLILSFVGVTSATVSNVTFQASFSAYIRSTANDPMQSSFNFTYGTAYAKGGARRMLATTLALPVSVIGFSSSAAASAFSSSAGGSSWAVSQFLSFQRLHSHFRSSTAYIYASQPQNLAPYFLRRTFRAGWLRASFSCCKYAAIANLVL